MQSRNRVVLLIHFKGFWKVTIVLLSCFHYHSTKVGDGGVANYQEIYLLTNPNQAIVSHS
jgi:hypothetical protein